MNRPDSGMRFSTAQRTARRLALPQVPPAPPLTATATELIIATGRGSGEEVAVSIGGVLNFDLEERCCLTLL